MLELKIFVWVQTFRRRPFVPSHNFCHPGQFYFKKISSRDLEPINFAIQLLRDVWVSPEIICISKNSERSTEAQIDFIVKQQQQHIYTSF